jgi:alpha/beta superfamily hydrolase
MSDPDFPADAGFLGGTAANLMLDGPAGALEVVVEVPDADAPARALIAVVCHPLTTEGGTMHNKVVTMACRALREVGATTVRFNFRGAGRSAGSFDHGEGECEDLRAVVAWVRRHRPDAVLWLGGFSFGAYVALRTAAELQPALLLSIAPPAGRSWDFRAMPLYSGPWLVIQGEADEVVDPASVYRWLDTIAELRQPPTLVRIPDTSHFFHGRLMDLRGAIKNGVNAHLPGRSPASNG